MSYTGTVEVISGLKQKNNAKFPIVEASAVWVSDNKSLEDLIDGLDGSSIKEYVDNKSSTQSSQYNDVINNHESRIGNIEQELNNNSLSAEVIHDILEETERASIAEEDLSNRIDTISNRVQFSRTSTDPRYANSLFIITDNNDNVLAYFDKDGDFHVNGNIYVNNW